MGGNPQPAAYPGAGLWRQKEVMKTLTAIHYISSKPEITTVVIAGHKPKTSMEAILFLSAHGDKGKWNVKPGTNPGTIIIL